MFIAYNMAQKYVTLIAKKLHLLPQRDVLPQLTMNLIYLFFLVCITGGVPSYFVHTKAFYMSVPNSLLHFSGINRVVLYITSSPPPRTPIKTRTIL